MSALSTICRVIQIAYSGANTICVIDKSLSNNNEVSGMRKISAASNIITIGCNVAEIAANLAGSSNTTLLKIKNGEVLTRLLTCSVQTTDALIEAVEDSVNGPFSTSDKVKTAEKLITPFISMLRSVAEASAYQQKVYLAMTPEELSKEKLPIYEGYGEDIRIVGWKPVTVEECTKTLESAIASGTTLNLTETALQAGITSNLVGKAQDVYDRIVRRLAAPPQQQLLLLAPELHL